MQIDELKQLMGAVAASDRRTIGKADVDFWARMASEGQWTLNTAMRALIQFRVSRPGEWLEPGHITGIIRDARKKAANSFVDPDALDGESGREYVERRRCLLREHTTRVLDAWAARGEPIPEAASVAELQSGEFGPRALVAGIEASTCPPELREQIERDLARAGGMNRLPKRPAEPDPEDDERAARREQARAELAALRDRTATTGAEDGAA